MTLRWTYDERFVDVVIEDDVPGLDAGSADAADAAPRCNVDPDADVELTYFDSCPTDRR